VYAYDSVDIAGRLCILWKGEGRAQPKLTSSNICDISLSPTGFHRCIFQRAYHYTSNRTDGLIVHKSKYIYTMKTGNEIWPQKSIIM